MSEGWRPRERTEHDRVSASAAQGLHDLLDRPGEPPGPGDPLPLLWHWAAFPPRARRSRLGLDGHPVPGDFLPPTGGRRRMYAGGRVVAVGLLRVEEPLERVSVVTEVVEKRGRTGPLLFVTVEHTLTGAAGHVQEQTTLVYREPASATPAVGPARDEPNPALDWPVADAVAVDPVLLFGFSALTRNAHRIHYDRDHAVGTEGYPGLVVHGPLQALLLVDLLTRRLGGAAVDDLTFRSTAPAFDGDGPLALRGRERGPGTWDLAVLAGAGARAGRRTMAATARVSPG